MYRMEKCKIERWMRRWKERGREREAVVIMDVIGFSPSLIRGGSMDQERASGKRESEGEREKVH